MCNNADQLMTYPLTIDFLLQPACRMDMLEQIKREYARMYTTILKPKGGRTEEATGLTSNAKGRGGGGGGLLTLVRASSIGDMS